MCAKFDAFTRFVTIFPLTDRTITGPAYIPVTGWEMTSLIDMEALVEIYRSKIFSLEAAIVLKFRKP